MTDIQLVSTDALIDELESRFPFFIAVWVNAEGQYRRSLAGDTATQGFAAIGCLEWAKTGVMESMNLMARQTTKEDAEDDPSDDTPEEETT